MPLASGGSSANVVKDPWEERPDSTADFELFEALPVGVAVVEPAHPYRCVYRNAVFTRWRWRGSNPVHGASIDEVLSDAVSEPAHVLGKVVETGRHHVLSVATADEHTVPVAVAGPIATRHGSAHSGALLLTAVADSLEGMGAGGDESGATTVKRAPSSTARSKSPRPTRLRSPAGIVIDAERHSVVKDGVVRRLTWTEWQLLWQFLRHPGTTFTRKQLAHTIWGDAGAVHPNQVDVYVSRVRQKVETNPKRPRLIATVRGVGYRLTPSGLEPE